MSVRQKTILVVDDEPDIVLSIAAILEDAGYAVKTVGRSDTLAQHLREDGQPDLILLDMLLSGRHGSDIARELKQQPTTRNIPILMLSAHPDAEQEARTAGANGFIAKPFDLDDLLAKVASYV